MKFSILALLFVGFASLGTADARVGYGNTGHVPQIAASLAVLVDENGRLRCRIEGEYGEFLSSGRFADFVENYPAVGGFVDLIGSLGQCDDRDLLYADVVLAPVGIEEIERVGVSPAMRWAIAAPFLLANTVWQCLAAVGDSWERHTAIWLEIGDLVVRSTFAAVVSSFFSPRNPSPSMRGLVIPWPILAAHYVVGLGSYVFCYNA